MLAIMQSDVQLLQNSVRLPAVRPLPDGAR
jgi:hypothetical protein